jgi:hypothetical protein
VCRPREQNVVHAFTASLALAGALGDFCAARRSPRGISVCDQRMRRLPKQRWRWHGMCTARSVITFRVRRWPQLPPSSAQTRHWQTLATRVCAAWLGSMAAAWQLTAAAQAQPRTVPDDQRPSSQHVEKPVAPGEPKDKDTDPNFRPENGYWSVGVPRFFLSTKSELGAPYGKPYFSVGYGLPHWMWAGVDANSILTTSMAQVYAGVRASSPVFDVAFGARDTWSFDKPFLTPAESYTRDDVLDRDGKRERSLALEFEAVATVPLPHAAIVGDFVMVDTLDLPKDKYIYDESYRLVTKKPFFCVMRVAAVARFLHENALKVGVLGEYGFNTGRDSGVFRLGPIGMLQVTDHLQIAAGVTLMVTSPDHLGLALGAYGVFGFRYQWATGERRPEWPWQGKIIPLQ